MVEGPLSSRQRFGFQFSVLARQWRRTLDESLERAGLSDATWAPLIHLQELGEGVTQKELAHRLGIDSSSLVRLLDILEQKGFIERQVGKDDRRARQIYLTGAGRAAIKDIRLVLSSAEAKMLADVSDAELDAVLHIFARIADRIRSMQDQQDGR
jgi:MarR family transcriptional regulator for hemolysin